jgi:hypothetical protein
MNFNSIHGIDRTYACITRNGKVKDYTFSISGYGAVDKRKEQRFRHLIDFMKIIYCYKDIKF